MESVVVIDFETTGLSPDQGARPTEIAAVMVRNGRVVDRYQSLMNAGVYVPPYITELTGISNDMVRKAPPAAKIMAEVAEFVGQAPLVAHNASFDRKFWDAELSRLRKRRNGEFVCSMLLARRLFPSAPDHKLGTLVRFAKLPVAGKSHRAMADAEMATSLLMKIEEDLVRKHQVRQVTHALLQELQRVPRHGVPAYIDRVRRT
jgi:DNA polymerase-3 subunit epsilon